MPNLPITCIISGKQTDGAVAVFEETIPPGEGPPLHAHRSQHEVFHIIEGTFRFQVDGEIIERGPGGSAVVPMGAAHAFKNIGETEGLIHFEMIPARNSEEGFGRMATERDQIEDMAAFFETYDIALLGPPLD